MSLILEPYNDKSFVIRGNTREYKDLLSQSHGRWNPNLIGGGGYIFSNKQLPQVQQLVNQINAGQIPAAYVTKQSKPYISSPSISVPGGQNFTLPVVSKMKTFTYTVHSANIDDLVTIEVDGAKLETRVSYVNPSGDIIQITLIADPTQIFEARVSAGDWQVRGEMRNHKLIFN